MPDFIPSTYCIGWSFLSGYGLKCYGCFDTHSWDRCKKTQRVQKCQPYQDACAKLHGKKRFDLYLKGCVPRGKYNGTSSLCHEQRFTECQITCCTTDLCNWAQEPMIGVPSFSLRKLLMNEKLNKMYYELRVFCFLFFLCSHCSDIVEGPA